MSHDDSLAHARISNKMLSLFLKGGSIRIAVESPLNVLRPLPEPDSAEDVSVTPQIDPARLMSRERLEEIMLQIQTKQYPDPAQVLWAMVDAKIVEDLLAEVLTVRRMLGLDYVIPQVDDDDLL